MLLAAAPAARFPLQARAHCAALQNQPAPGNQCDRGTPTRPEQSQKAPDSPPLPAAAAAVGHSPSRRPFTAARAALQTAPLFLLRGAARDSSTGQPPLTGSHRSCLGGCLNLLQTNKNPPETRVTVATATSPPPQARYFLTLLSSSSSGAATPPLPTPSPALGHQQLHAGLILLEQKCLTHHFIVRNKGRPWLPWEQPGEGSGGTR